MVFVSLWIISGLTDHRLDNTGTRAAVLYMFRSHDVQVV